MLPKITTREEYSHIYADDDRWLPAMRAIAARHRLPGRPVRQTLGSNVVYGFADRIVKLFPPFFGADFAAEKAALSAAARLRVPEVVGEGELEGWKYLIVTRVRGIPAVDVWMDLTVRDKRNILLQLGELIRSLHSCAVTDNARRDWEGFFKRRLQGAPDHHSVGEPWRRWIAGRTASFHAPHCPSVLVHGDLTQDHVLLTRNAGTWCISGLIDFGDARVGHPYYDFIVPLLDYTYGLPGLADALLSSYGLRVPVTPQVADALTTFCLLHEFATLGDHLRRCPSESPAQFTDLLWGRALVIRAKYRCYSSTQSLSARNRR